MSRSGNWSFYADQWIPSGMDIGGWWEYHIGFWEAEYYTCTGRDWWCAAEILRCLWSSSSRIQLEDPSLRLRECGWLWIIITFRRNHVITRIFPKVQAAGLVHFVNWWIFNVNLWSWTFKADFVKINGPISFLWKGKKSVCLQLHGCDPHVKSQNHRRYHLYFLQFIKTQSQPDIW